MQFNNYIKTKLPFFVALSFTFVLASCGSYQYVGYESDGIYSDSESTYEEAATAQPETAVTYTEDNSYYKNYFNEKVNQYSDIPEDESVIFTDIESYEGDYSDENQQEGVQNEYVGWGQASNNVTINYIDNSWGFYDPWLWNSAWGYGYGWNSWRYNNWGWNAGYVGFGWGWNNYWGYNNWGWGYSNYWCPPGFHGYYYNNRNLAYNSGRRGSVLAYTNRNSISRRNSNIYRRNTSAVSRRGSTTRNNSATRSTVRRNNTSTRSNNSSVRPRTNTRSNSSRVTRPRSSSTRSNSSRMTTPRSSRSSSARSSGSSRSSGNSTTTRRSNSSRRR